MELNRPWYYRSVNEPYEELAVDASTGEEVPVVKIIIWGARGWADPDLLTSEYSSDALKRQAVTRIINFYGKTGIFYPEGLLAMTVYLLEVEDHHFSRRPNSRVLLLYSITKLRVNLLMEATVPYFNIDDDGIPIDPTPVVHTAEIFTSKLETQMSDIELMFSNYQNKLRFFNGQLKPSFNFNDEFGRLTYAIDRIEQFIKFNGYEYQEASEEKIIINFNQDYDILFIEYGSKGIIRPLIKGNRYFLRESRGLNNPRTNQLLSSLNDIYEEKASPPPWSKFIVQYTNNIEVDFFGRPSSARIDFLLWSEQKANNQLFQNSGQVAREHAAVYTNAAQYMNEAMIQTEESEKDRLRAVAQQINQLQDKAKVVEHYMNTYGITTLIEAALECAALQAAQDGLAFPDVKAIWEALKGIDPYEIQGVSGPGETWKLPRLPTELPVISIQGELTDQIKTMLNDALLGLIVGMAKALADLLLEMCKGFDEEEIGTAPSLAVIANAHPNLSDFSQEENCLLSHYEAWGIEIDDGNSFLEELAQVITPEENCNLISGSPLSPALVTVVQDVANLGQFNGTSIEELFGIEDSTNLEDFFSYLGTHCISPDYCNSIYNAPPFPIPPDIDPCEIEDQLAAGLPDEVLEQLLELYNNLETPQLPDMGCGAGIVPSFSNNPSLMHSIITMMNALFEGAQGSFIQEIDGVKQAFIEIFPGDMDPAYWAVMQRTFQDDPMADPEADPEPTAEDEAVSGLLGGLEDIANEAGGGLIASFQTLVLRQQQRDFMRAESAAAYRVAGEYRNKFAGLARTNYDNNPGSYSATGFEFGPFKGAARSPFPGPAQSIYVPLLNKIRTFYLKSRLVDPTTDSVFFAITNNQYVLQNVNGAGPDYGPVGSSTNLIGMPNALYSPLPSSIFYEGTFKLFHDVPASYAETTPQGATDNVTRFIDHNQYFLAVISALGSMANSVAKDRLFDYTAFSNLLLVPRPCTNDNRLSIGDLFDIQRIINEAIEEFKENSCSQVPCIIGPVEDAVVFGSVNAYIQILVVQQLLKNIFFIDTYGLGDYISRPIILDRITREIKEDLLNEVATSAEVQEQLYSFGSDSDINPGAIGILTYNNIKKAAMMYIKKRLLRSNTGTTLPDPFGGPDIEVPSLWLSATGDPDYVAYQENFEQFALDYLIRKRLKSTVPAVREVFNIPAGNFGKLFLQRALPQVDLVQGMPRETGRVIPPNEPFYCTQEVDIPAGPEAGPWVDIPTLVVKGCHHIDGDLGLGAGLQRLGFPEAPGLATYVDEEGPLTTSWSEVPSKDVGAFGVERYIKFNFDLGALEELLSNSDINGTTLQRINYNNYIRIKILLDETLLAGVPYEDLPGTAVVGPGDPPPGGSGDYFVTLETYILFVEQLGELISRDEMISEMDIGSVMDMNITYTWGQPQIFMATGESQVAGTEVLLSGNPWDTIYSSFSGPLTIDNFDAIRFWYNEVQKVALSEMLELEADPDASQTGTVVQVAPFGLGIVTEGNETVLSDYYRNTVHIGTNTFDTNTFLKGPWKWKTLGPRWQHPTWQLPAPWSGKTAVPLNDTTGPVTSDEEIILGNTTSFPPLKSFDAALDDSVVVTSTGFGFPTSEDGEPNWTQFTGADDVDQAASWVWNSFGQNKFYQDNFVPDMRYYPAGSSWNNDFPGPNDDDYRDAKTVKRLLSPRHLNDINYVNFGDSWVEGEEESDRIGMLYYDHDGTTMTKYYYRPMKEDIYGWVGYTTSGGSHPYGDLSTEDMIKLRQNLNPYTIFKRATWIGFWNEPHAVGVGALIHRDVLDNTPLFDSAGFFVGPGSPADLPIPRDPNDWDPWSDYLTENNPLWQQCVDYLTDIQILFLLRTFVKPGKYTNPPFGNAAAGRNGYGLIMPGVDGFASENDVTAMEAGADPEVLSPSSQEGAHPYIEDSTILTLQSYSDPKTIKYINGIYISDPEAFEAVRNINSLEMGAYIAAEEEGIEVETVTQALESIFPDGFHTGMRVVYYTQQLGGGDLDSLAGLTVFKGELASMIQEMSFEQQEENYYKTRQNFLLDTTLDTGVFMRESGIVANIGTAVDASVPLWNSMAATVEALAIVPGYESVFVNSRIKSEEDGLYNDMSNSASFSALFENSIKIDEMAAFLFMIGLDLADTPLTIRDWVGTRAGKISSIFNDTKAQIRAVLRGALAGDSYRFTGGGRTQADLDRDFALAAAGVAMPIAEMGASFILKMIIDVPKQIVKMLAEMIDPHVVFGKQIRDASGIIMNEVASHAPVSIDQIVDIVQQAIDQSSSGLQGPLSNDEWLIVKEYFLPKAKKTGIELTGRMPYLLAIPPTPLGLIYILLNLMDQGPIDFGDLSGCSAEYLEEMAPDPYGPTDELPENPSSTYQCPDEEES